MRELQKLNIADGQIVDITKYFPDLELVLKDWKENVHKFRFINVSGVEVYAPFHRDISHCEIDQELSYLQTIEDLSKEECEHIHRITFYSAWEDGILLRVYCAKVIQQR